MANKFVLNDHFKEIISLFEKSSKNIFITGKAGTGKSSLIRYLKNNTKKNLSYNKIRTFKDINKTTFLMVEFSDKVKNSENEIRYFLKTKMYNNKNVLDKNNKGKEIIKRLFNKIKQDPKKFLSKEQISINKFRAISDFISGMTDRYAINLNNKVK